MRKVEYNGKLLDAQVMDFETLKPEQFSVHKLTDGTIVKVRHTVNEIVRIVPNGEPAYLAYNNISVMTQAKPENIKHAATAALNKVQ